VGSKQNATNGMTDPPVFGQSGAGIKKKLIMPATLPGTGIRQCSRAFFASELD
jgi:hypothetical protein